MAAAASGYVPLEIDPESGTRGGRMDELSGLMRALTGAESTLVVNNNAAAVLLTMAALAEGREVVVSRGEAVEIGGGFRIPDVMRQSGAILVEVGTTNRTHPSDYEKAITGQTAAILKVHQSNFRIEGFTASATIEDLARLCDRCRIPLVDDLGSGSLLQPGDFGLARERTIAESLASGATVVTASGDKLLGGPQCGIICGKLSIMEQISRHPFARAVRADKATLAGLGATLRHYLRGEAVESIPVWRMIAAPDALLRSRAEGMRDRLQSAGRDVSIVRSESTVGGGSLPGELLPSWALSLGPIGERSVLDVAFRLRQGRPAVFGRVLQGRLLLDLRTVDQEDDPALLKSVEALYDFKA
jgi:L-seryl-tRNA(Ser) seleniumtransferase